MKVVTVYQSASFVVEHPDKCQEVPRVTLVSFDSHRQVAVLRADCDCQEARIVSLRASAGL